MNPGQIFIQFDGGCIPNPGSMYGSYSITHDHGFLGGPRPIETKCKWRLGMGTNNRAEYGIMIKAIERTVELLAVAGLSPKLFGVLLISDSSILVHRMNGSQLTKGNSDINQLAKRAQTLLEQFKTYEAQWVDRDRMVELFGH